MPPRPPRMEGVPEQIPLLGLLDQNFRLSRQARHVREARRPAARTHTNEALLRVVLQANVARLTFGVLLAPLDSFSDCIRVPFVRVVLLRAAPACNRSTYFPVAAAAPSGSARSAHCSIEWRTAHCTASSGLVRGSGAAQAVHSVRIILPRGILRDERLESSESEIFCSQHQFRVAAGQLDARARVFQRFVNCSVVRLALTCTRADAQRAAQTFLGLSERSSIVRRMAVLIAATGLRGRRVGHGWRSVHQYAAAAARGCGQPAGSAHNSCSTQQKEHAARVQQERARVFSELNGFS